MTGSNALFFTFDISTQLFVLHSMSAKLFCVFEVLWLKSAHKFFRNSNIMGCNHGKQAG